MASMSSVVVKEGEYRMQVRVVFLETVMPMVNPVNRPYFSDIVGVILAVI